MQLEAETCEIEDWSEYTCKHKHKYKYMNTGAFVLFLNAASLLVRWFFVCIAVVFCRNQLSMGPGIQSPNLQRSSNVDV